VRSARVRMANVRMAHDTRKVAARLAALTFALHGALAGAQAYPSKPIRMLVPAAPGIMQDILSRGFVEPLSKAFGQPIVVDNRIGADGVIGMEICARAAPDGYTLCNTMSGAIIWNPALRLNLPYDAVQDFVPIVQTGFFDSALVAYPGLAADSLPELIDLVKQRPNAINWATFGVNSTGYMYMEWLKRARGAAFYHVPYKTQPQGLQALMSGESQLAVYGLSSIAALVKAGKLKLIGVSSPRRQDWLPQVPTFEELGIKLPLRTWFGYHFPAGTPREIVLRLNAEIRKAMADPGFREGILARQMITPADGTPEEFDAYIRTQRGEVAELVKFLGLKPE
jgi:tripartite-type tricarboxylate transporter receptor subunit TctC